MPKKLPSPKEMKRAVEEFKKQFTTGFYHGSPSNKIKAFDPKHPAADFEKSAEAVYLSRDPSFSNSILPMGNAAGYRPGSTVYPVSANLGKHFDYETPEGQSLIKEYLASTMPVPKKEASQDELTWWMKNRANVSDALNKGSWDEIEDPAFQELLKQKGYDSFSMQEAGRKNVGIFDPANIRGKFAEYNPEEAANPDFMKAAGGSITKAAKKALEHARKVPFVHFSNKENLTELDPRYYGTGIKGAEAARLKQAPDIRPRSYFYTDRPDVRPEAGLGSHKYSGVAEDIYPLHEDPAGYSAIAKTKAIDPYMMQFGREVIDTPTHLNELERLIKSAGYKGYANDDVGLLFDPTPVFKAE